MKNQKFYSIIFTLCLVFTFSPFIAQITNVWIGGCPGHESDWDYYKNWSENQVPDWSSDVIIPNNFSNTQYFPVVSNQLVEVNSLQIHSGAELIIEEDASLAVTNEEYRNQPVINKGEIIARGTIEFEDYLYKNTLVRD